MVGLLVVGAVLAFAACSTSTSPLSEEEQRSQSLDRSLICPICPGETIDRSQVLLADQMQVIVREQIQQGKTDREIQQFFVDRYGERVLAAPRKEGFNLLMWIVPPVGVVLALYVLYRVTHSMMRRGPAPALRTSNAGSNDGELDAYLEMVDRELGEAADTSNRQDVDGKEGT